MVSGFSHVYNIHEVKWQDILRRAVKNKSNITVFIEVYNEESRIESCLRSFQWADEVIIFDKHSTDRTREIASKFATEVVLVPFCEGSENVVNNISGYSSREWCLFASASSLMHPDLVDEIIKHTTDEKFNFDVIGMPYGIYSMGIRSIRSPFFISHKHTLIRRSKLKLSTKLHNEISYVGDEVFNMPFINEEAVLYHCTHKNVESLLAHEVRYTKYEAKQDSSLNSVKAFWGIWKAVIVVLFRRKTFLLGWDGIALSLAYIAYFILRFLFVWEGNRKGGEIIYSELRNKIDALWSAREGLNKSADADH